MFSACEQKRNPDCPTKASRAWRTRIVHVSNAAEMKLVFNQQQKAPQSIQVASYLTDPTDAFTVVVFSAKLPDSTNHVATVQVNEVSGQLGVQIQNSAYQPAQRASWQSRFLRCIAKLNIGIIDIGHRPTYKSRLQD
jgi:hypothetical protein